MLSGTMVISDMLSDLVITPLDSLRSFVKDANPKLLFNARETIGIKTPKNKARARKDKETIATNLGSGMLPFSFLVLKLKSGLSFMSLVKVKKVMINVNAMGIRLK